MSAYSPLGAPRHTRTLPLRPFLVLPATALLALACAAALFSARPRAQQPASLPSPAEHGATVLPSYITALHSLRSQLAGAMNVSEGELVFEGHSGQSVEQTVYYATVMAREGWIRRICETGFNAGHSAVTFLSSNPNAELYSFDYLGHGYSLAAREAVSALFPGRLRVIGGDSAATVPAFAAEHPDHRCDFISVDGGHSYELATADLRNFARMAAERNLVVIDDVECAEHYCEGPKRAWEDVKREGLVREMACYPLDFGKRGFCIGRYEV